MFDGDPVIFSSRTPAAVDCRIIVRRRVSVADRAQFGPKALMRSVRVDRLPGK